MENNKNGANALAFTLLEKAGIIYKKENKFFLVSACGEDYLFRDDDCSEDAIGKNAVESLQYISDYSVDELPNAAHISFNIEDICEEYEATEIKGLYIYHGKDFCRLTGLAKDDTMED